MLLPEAASKLVRKAVQSCSTKMFPGAAPQSCAPKLFSKVAALKLRFCKTCSPKRLPKAILQSGSRKLRLKVTTRSYCPKLWPQSCNLSNLYTKTAPQSYSATKVATESCSLKMFVKLPPKDVVLRSNCSWKLLRTACQSCSPKRFPEAASQSCSPKYLCKVVAPKRLCRLCFKPVPQS